jgi:hypothetical protein
MMETIRFTPSWLLRAQTEPMKKGGKRPKLPVFILKAGSITERDLFEAELEGRYGAGMVMSFQLLDAAVNGVRALLGDEGGAIEELLRADYASSLSAADGEQLSPIDKAKLKSATEILAGSWPEYAGLVEREARRNSLLPTLAFSRWCDGWENLADRHGKPVEFARDATGGIPDGVLRRVDFTMIRSAGLEAYALQYGRSHAKN